MEKILSIDKLFKSYNYALDEKNLTRLFVYIH